ncbi:MAG: hypothetical protein NDI90_08445 [Nitrospira sp. BO4]|nr:hypothetical protein [Nitrospira sp. BO4]
MARTRAADHQRPRSKTALIEEITHGINKFQEVLTAIKDLSQEGFPYRDAAQSKAELQFRECLRQTFGERSHEYQTYRNFKIRTADKSQAAQTLSVIKDLMHTLEDRKLELQGLKPPPKPEPPHEASINNTARLVLVSPATPTTVTTQATSPMTVAVAMTTNVGPSIPPVTPIPHVQSAATEPRITASTPAPIPAPTPTPMPIPAASEAPAAPIQESSSPPITTPPAQAILSAVDSSVEEKQVPPSPAVVPSSPSIPAQPHVNSPPPTVSTHTVPPAMTHSVVPPPHDPQIEKPSISLSSDRLVESVLAPAIDQDPLHVIRKVCLRFHAVARQLRLRRDYRPTLEVEDDYDLQDLLCALLKVEFDEVATDEWTPPYTGGAPRTTLLVNRDQIAVVAKKTRPGLTTKELADQVTADSAHYRTQGRCSTLFCFMYDPEGRIGSPKRLETTLTSVSEHCRVEVLVAPK